MSSRSCAAALAVAALLGVPDRAWAFKMRTHVWIGQQVLNDALDGAVTIPSFADPIPVSADALAALRASPAAYRIGNIGPDGFPDIVGGQITMHPGLDGMMQADDWLARVLGGSEDPVERAFAYGYAAHAAADVFAHTWVNSYSGEIFDLLDSGSLGDARTIEEELRHIALETFVESFLPEILDADGQPVPVDAAAPSTFLAHALVLDADVANQYRHAGARHLVAMYEVWAALDEVIRKGEAASARIDEAVAPYRTAISDLRAQIAELEAQANRLIVCRRIFGKRICIILEPFTYATLMGTIQSLRVALAQAEITLDATVLAVELAGQGMLAPMYAWRDGVEAAVANYVQASEATALRLATGVADPLLPMRDWLLCWGPVFSGVPPAAGSLCEGSFGFVAELPGVLSNLRDKLGAAGWLVDPAGMAFDEVQQVIDERLMPTLGIATADLTSAVFGADSLIASVATLLLKPIGPADLDQIYGTDESSKLLLEIPDASSRVLSEMHVAGGRFSPELFRVVRNAVVLAKLSLLSPETLNALVASRGITATAYGTDLYGPAAPFSVLLDAVRSIDGSHQWQEVAMPYPRRGGALDGVRREYGRAFDGVHGFRLWQDCAVRKEVFLRVFEGPLAPGLAGIPGAEVLGETPDDPFPISPGSTVSDVTPPMPAVSPLPAETRECPALVDWSPAAIDLCDGAVSTSLVGAAAFPARGTYPLSWRHADSAGNASVQPQTLVVVDTSPPSLVPPPLVVAEQAALAGTAVALPAPVTAYACAGAVTVTHDAPAVFPLGDTVVTYRAQDGAGNATEATTTVRIVDTTAPVLANVAPPVRVEQETHAGTAVALPLPTATDICDAAPAVASDAPAVFPLGDNLVTFTATDASGNSGSATTTVVVYDETPPVVSAVTPSTDVLWPPNHELVPVSIAVAVTDVCDVAPACRIKAVESVEASRVAMTRPASMADVGAGNTSPDHVVAGDLDVHLRAERSGASTGRTYVITVECLDASGNAASDVARVTVPHDAS